MAATPTRPNWTGAPVKKKNTPHAPSFSPAQQLAQTYQAHTGAAAPPDLISYFQAVERMNDPALIQQAQAKITEIARQSGNNASQTANQLRTAFNPYNDPLAREIAYAEQRARTGTDNPAVQRDPRYRPGGLSAASGGSSGSGGSYSNDAIIKQLQKQQDAANKANTDRYNQMLGNNDAARTELLGTLGSSRDAQIAAITGNRDTQLGTINDSYNKIFGLIGSGEATALEREGKRQANEVGAVGQNVMDRGLANTTIADSLRRGVIDDSALRQREIQAQTNQERMGVQQNYGNQLLGVQQNYGNQMLGAQQNYGQSLLGTQQYLYGDRNQIIGNRTDTGPDFGQWMSLLSQPRYGSGAGQPAYQPAGSSLRNDLTANYQVRQANQAAAGQAGPDMSFLKQQQLAKQQPGYNPNPSGTPWGTQKTQSLSNYNQPSWDQIQAQIAAQNQQSAEQQKQQNLAESMARWNAWYQNRMAGIGGTHDPTGQLMNFVGNLKSMQMGPDHFDGSSGVANGNFPGYTPTTRFTPANLQKVVNATYKVPTYIPQYVGTAGPVKRANPLDPYNPWS